MSKTTHNALVATAPPWTPLGELNRTARTPSRSSRFERGRFVVGNGTGERRRQGRREEKGDVREGKGKGRRRKGKEKTRKGRGRACHIMCRCVAPPMVQCLYWSLTIQYKQAIWYKYVVCACTVV